jgi:hypothetical protein
VRRPEVYHGTPASVLLQYAEMLGKLIRCPLAAVVLVTTLATPATVFAQAGESDLRVYGYLQASFYHETIDDYPDRNNNSFTVQQLDIMLQKDLGRRWSAFVDLLMTNNYSSFRNVGTFDLQQAWVRYRRNYLLNVKMGLLIPHFNYLNEIKNKMPVLPYIIRPIVYETSFQEDVWIDEFVPQQAFVQAYGYAPAGEFKIEYAAYVGNSPNTSTAENTQTGIDTTTTFLMGGRIGVRHPFFELGFSATHDNVNFLRGVDDQVTPPLTFSEVPRVRMGVDAAVEYRSVSLRGEFINVDYDDDDPIVNVDKRFWYGTLSYRFNPKLLAYGTYWYLQQHMVQRTPPNNYLVGKWQMAIPGVGVAYQMSDRVAFKGAFARGIQKWNIPQPEYSFNFYAVAVSVMF